MDIELLSLVVVGLMARLLVAFIGFWLMVLVFVVGILVGARFKFQMRKKN
jgi:uncharacterized membrane protein